MAHPNEELLRTLYDAFSKRDLGTVKGLLTEDAVLHQPGRNPLSGHYEGIDAVPGVLRQLGERSGGTFRSELHDVIAGDEHAIGLLNVSGQREGRSMDVPAVHVWHMRDGRLAELWVHPADQYMVDEFWA
jgi:ketosteroid isomerase-like protein